MVDIVNLPEEFIDLFYYYVLIDVDSFDLQLFSPYLKRLPEDKRQVLRNFINDLLDQEKNPGPSRQLALEFVKRVKLTYKGAGLIVPVAIVALLEADLKAGFMVGHFFVKELYKTSDKLKKVILDTLIQFALTKEEVDTPAFKAIVEVIKSIDLDDEDRGRALLFMAKNIKTEVGERILEVIDIAPLKPENLLSTFTLCDYKCSRVLVRSVLKRKDDQVLIKLIKGIISEPTKDVLALLGKLYRCIPDDIEGKPYRERIKATTVLLMRDKDKRRSVFNTRVSVDLLLAMSFCLGATADSQNFIEYAIKGFIELLLDETLDDEDYRVLGPVMVSILSKVTNRSKMMVVFNNKIGKILGKLHLMNSNEGTKERAQRAFDVLKYLVDEQTKIPFPLTTLTQIWENIE